MSALTFMPDNPKHVELLQQEFPFGSYIPETEHRGITVFQLRKVVTFAKKYCTKWHDLGGPSSGQKLDMESLNLYQLNEWLIKPACLQHQCAMVELFAKTKQTPDWFISHWWGEPIAEFLLCVEKHISVRALTADCPYWVCAYANRQHYLVEDVCADPRQTSFFKAMLLAKGVLLILDTVGPATPFRRVWCAFEEAVLMLGDESAGGTCNKHTDSMLLDIATTVVHRQPGKTTSKKTAELITDGVAPTDEDFFHVGGAEKYKAEREASFPIKIIKEGLHLELEKSEATNPADRLHILNCLVGREIEAFPPLDQHENYTKINRRLRAIFAVSTWRQAVESKGGSIVRELGLAQVVAADVWRESLYLNLAFARIIDNDLEDVSMALTSQLQRLELDLRACLMITDAGLANMAGYFPSLANLEYLKLTMSGCRMISDAGVTPLARKLPEKVTSLELNLRDCPLVSSSSVIAIGAMVQNSSITELDLNFGLCGQVNNAALYNLLCNIPPTMEHLYLHFRKTAISDDIIELMHKILPDREEARRREELLTQAKPAYIFEGETGPYYIVRKTKVVANLADFDNRDAQPVAELTLGSVVNALEVLCEENQRRIFAYLQQPAGWITVLDTEAAMRWATHERQDTPGRYLVLRDRTFVGFEAERVGEGAGVINKGTWVEVLQILNCAKINRVRAQISKPHGWITVLNKDSGARFATPVAEMEKPAHTEVVPVRTAVQMLQDTLKGRVGRLAAATVAAPSYKRNKLSMPAKGKKLTLLENFDPQVDMPGKYIVIRDKINVRSELLEYDEDHVGTLVHAQYFDVLEVVHDTENHVVCGRVTKPPGWVSLIHLETGYRSATLDIEDKIGQYIVLRSLVVERQLNLMGDRVGTVLKDSFVTVEEVQKSVATNKIMGRIQEPPGWIILFDLERNQRCAAAFVKEVAEEVRPEVTGVRTMVPPKKSTGRYTVTLRSMALKPALPVFKNSGSSKAVYNKGQRKGKIAGATMDMKQRFSKRLSQLIGVSTPIEEEAEPDLEDGGSPPLTDGHMSPISERPSAIMLSATEREDDEEEIRTKRRACKCTVQ